MNEETSALEDQLRALQLTGKSAESAMLFYRCGFEAAKAERKEVAPSAPNRSWQTFCGGAASGILASVLLVVCWMQAGLPAESTNDNSAVVEETTANDSDQKIERRSSDIDVDSTQEIADDLAEIGPVNFSELFPWSWPTDKGDEDIGELARTPLSPAANSQWVSLVEECADPSSDASL